MTVLIVGVTNTASPTDSFREIREYINDGTINELSTSSYDKPITILKGGFKLVGPPLSIFHPGFSQEADVYEWWFQR